MARALRSILLVTATLLASLLIGPPSPASTALPLRLLVKGDRLIAASGRPVVLDGVNRSGTEYMCVHGSGVFDGPAGAALSEAMRRWAVDVVRIPLNEDCWLGINVPAADAGPTYRKAIVGEVEALRAAGIDAVLDLHWSAPGAEVASGQQEMPDLHAIAFWRSVGRTFRTTPGVAFELYNEPHDVSWACWRAGCTTTQGWRAVGMQQLIDVVRSTGARQPILVDGLDWANDLSGFAAAHLRDPAASLVAAFHAYPWSSCATPSCWRRMLVPLATRYPVVATEVGEADCSGRFVAAFLRWSAPHGISAIAWAWTDDEGCLSLVANGAGTPTRYGAAVRSALRSIAARR